MLGDLPSDDMEPTYGSVYFTSNQASEDIVLRVKADDIPEPTEVRPTLSHSIYRS